MKPLYAFLLGLLFLAILTPAGKWLERWLKAGEQEIEP